MKQLIQSLIPILLISVARAVPVLIPYPAVEFTATIQEFKPAKAQGVVIVVLEDYEGLDDDKAKALYKALRHRAGFRVRYPRKSSIELVFPRGKANKLTVGDRVRISGYCVQGHSESRGFWICDGADITKVAKGKR